MRRKLMKFANGGSDARYQRKIADIESDYKKHTASGKDVGVAKAKYEQRMADAKDDLAKRTGSDRSKTSAAEKAAEKNLSMTRRYGSRTSALDGAKNPPPRKALDIGKIDVGSTPKLKMSFREAFRAARERGDKTFSWDGKPGTTFTTKMDSDKPAAKPAAKPADKPAAKRADKPADKPTANTPPQPPETTGPPITVVGNKQRTYSSAESRERGGRALAAPFRAFAEYGNPVSLLGRAVFDGNPAKSSAPAQKTAKTDTRAEAIEKKRRQIEAAGAAPNAPSYDKMQAKFYKQYPDHVTPYARGGKMKKFADGGSTQYPIKIDLNKAKRDTAARDAKAAENKRTPREEAEKKAMEKKYPFNKYASGGVTKQMPTADQMGSMGMAKGGGMERRGKTSAKMVKMAKGGSINGVAQRGKTRCKGMK